VSDPRTVETSGDLSLAGSERPPIAVGGTEDVFFQPESVTGDVHVTDAEYVFTHQSVDETGGVPDPETELVGDEDAYVESGGVDGDLILSGVADVFVPADSAEGTLSVVGGENVYSAAGPDTDPTDYDRRTHGWQQTGSVADPDVGVSATGAGHEVTVTRARGEIEVYVVGWDHEVSIEGRGAQVTVYVCGYENTVSVGPYCAVEVAGEAGFDNTVESAPYPAADLIEQSKREAFRTAGFGRQKVIYQQEATDEEWCPNCGEPADAVVERHQMEAWFLFGYPLVTYDRSTTPARECEHCSPNAVEAATLTPDERREVLE